jgi:hypothetical protein
MTIRIGAVVRFDRSIAESVVATAGCYHACWWRRLVAIALVGGDGWLLLRLLVMGDWVISLVPIAWSITFREP